MKIIMPRRKKVKFKSPVILRRRIKKRAYTLKHKRTKIISGGAGIFLLTPNGTHPNNILLCFPGYCAARGYVISCRNCRNRRSS